MSQTLIFLDVETLPPQNETFAMRATELLTPPSNYKKEEAINNWREAQKERLGLHTWAAEPCTLVMQREGEDPFACQREPHQGPQSFFNRLAFELEAWLEPVDIPTIHLVGWNVGFDISMLRAWSARYAEKLPFYLPDTRYPKTATDVMDMWNPWDRTSLRKAHYAITGEVYDDLGSDVAWLWGEDNTGEILNHCLLDVERTMEIYHRLDTWLR